MFCPKCQYPTPVQHRAGVKATCPECGAIEFPVAELPPSRRAAWKFRLLFAALTFAPMGCFVFPMWREGISSGSIDKWALVGMTYFALVALPALPLVVTVTGGGVLKAATGGRYGFAVAGQGGLIGTGLSIVAMLGLAVFKHSGGC